MKKGFCTGIIYIYYNNSMHIMSHNFTCITSSSHIIIKLNHRFPFSQKIFYLTRSIMTNVKPAPYYINRPAILGVWADEAFAFVKLIIVIQSFFMLTCSVLFVLSIDHIMIIVIVKRKP